MFDFLKHGKVTLKDVEKSIKDLPLPEKIRALAIYKRYKQISIMEDQMAKAIKNVEKEYLKYDQPILANISKIVQGVQAPKEKELKDLDNYLTTQEKQKVSEHMGATKIPQYWLKVFKTSGILSAQISSDDQGLLRHVDNIHVIDQQGTDNFTIVFEMSDNQYITNKELTQKFYMKNEQTQKCEASKIEWKGRNLTMKQIKKKQKNKKTGQQRVVTKSVQSKSFFNFFHSLEAPQVTSYQANQEQLQKRQKLDQLFQVGGHLVDEVLPYSLQYYLGIQHEHEHDEDFDDQQIIQSDDLEEDTKPKKKQKSKGKNKKSSGDKGGTEQKPECNQQ